MPGHCMLGSEHAMYAQRALRAGHAGMPTKELIPLYEHGKVFCYLFRALDHATILAHTMYLTAAYRYFYFYAFDPGGMT